MRTNLILIAGVVFAFGIDNSVGMTVDPAKLNNEEVFLPVLRKNKTDSQKDILACNVLPTQSNCLETSVSAGGLVSKTSSAVNSSKKAFSFLFNEKKDEPLSELKRQLEEKNRDLSNQIDEIKREITAACYFIQKNQKQIDAIQKEINGTQKMIDFLQQQAIYQNQGMTSLSKQINEMSQDICDLKRTVTILIKLMQLTPCPVVPGFTPQAPFYPIPQGVIPHPPVYPMAPQKKSFDQPLP